MRQTISMEDGRIPIGKGKRKYSNGKFKWTGKTRYLPSFIEVYVTYNLELNGIHYTMLAGRNFEDGYCLWRGDDSNPTTYDIFSTKLELLTEFARIVQRAEKIRTEENKNAI